ncbi:hypothetical protein KHS38_18630 [Mucilaginibacter sp. Bleaf8]|uniref:hypothetical protein n=1 Tax=Mucilaginibacter sp. Bleaf8 TaxID=2834430 RepID=UPI001BCB90EB|nr:hypothetical protein [Mucilaginibacter sp. Bleaf8]MBS7566432.1 hypothetical protein [Mucilaginibacter sp. Bleaf8]
MKKFSSYLLTGLIATSMLASCGKDDNNDNGGTQPVTPVPTSTTLTGAISSSMTLTKDKTWTLDGFVYVTNNATLTIQPGTKIVSKRANAGVLVITRGSKIEAKGTAAEPIVFTSAEASPIPGDLGGVVVAGSATANGNHAQMEGVTDVNYNKFGGTNDADNSGTLQYIRIEYAGKTANPNDEVNGLSMYGVGSGTTVDHIQVSRGLDDAFEFFGGSFNAKYLIAYNCADDDFDFDDGYHGNLQYLISFKDPAFTDTKSGGDFSNNLEWDNVSASSKGYATPPITHARISNLTAIGPNNVSSSVLTNYGYGARFRRGSQFEIVNSVFLGTRLAAFSLEVAETGAAYKNGTSIFKNNVIQSSAASPFNAGADAGITVEEMQSLATGLSILTNPADAKLTDAFNVASPKLMPQTGSPLLAGASFTGNFTTANGFETNVAFKGALGTTDWTSGWAVFNK